VRVNRLLAAPTFFSFEHFRRTSAMMLSRGTQIVRARDYIKRIAKIEIGAQMRRHRIEDDGCGRPVDVDGNPPASEPGIGRNKSLIFRRSPGKDRS